MSWERTKGLRAFSRRRYVNFQSLILYSDLRRYDWLVCKKGNRING